MIRVKQPYCCYWKLNVPEGIITMGQTFGKDDGIMSPGCYCCFCNHRNIAAMVTKNSIRYDTPVIFL